MFSRLEVKVEGITELNRALRGAGSDAQDMKDLMHELGTIVIDAAQPPVKSGRLASSLRAGRGKTKAVARAGGARVPYAGVIHYGWPARGIPASNYLSTALQRKQGEVFAAFQEGAVEILKKNDLI